MDDTERVTKGNVNHIAIRRPIMSMIEQASKMEEVFINLQCAKTLSGFLDEYFEETNPDTAMLHARYRMYGDLNCVLYKTVSDAQEAVSQIIDEIYTQHKKPA